MSNLTPEQKRLMADILKDAQDNMWNRLFLPTAYEVGRDFGDCCDSTIAVGLANHTVRTAKPLIVVDDNIVDSTAKVIK